MKNRVNLEIPVFLAGPEVPVERLELTSPVLLHPSVTPAELKLGGARFYLAMLRKHCNDEVTGIFFFEAFLHFARSFTLALQKQCALREGFAPWYEKAKNQLSSNPICKKFLGLRNEAVHEQSPAPRLSFRQESRHHLDGSVSVGQMHLELVFLDGTKSETPLDDCSEYLRVLEGVLESAKNAGFIQPTQPTTSRVFGINFLRQTPGGEWKLFNPPHWQPKPEEFPSRSEYDEWRRSLPRRNLAAERQKVAEQDS